MKLYNREKDGPLKKGTMFIDGAKWVGIVTEAERTKNYKPHNIINCAEMYGFYHESGSKYANEVVALLTKDEFEAGKKALGFENESNYFKGELIEP